MSQPPASEFQSERKRSSQLLDLSKIRELVKREKSLGRTQHASLEINPSDQDASRFSPSKFMTPIRNPRTVLMSPDNQKIDPISEDVEIKQFHVYSSD